jgi:hypothetical protein
VDDHVATCAACRLELERLSAADTGEPVDADLFDAMLQEAAAWEAGHDRAWVRAAVTNGVRPYLGDRATERLSEGGPADGSGLVSALEPALALFLGKETACQLVSHILDRALVRP